MLKYDDCGLRNIWLANGFRYEEIEGHGKCLEIDNIEGLNRPCFTRYPSEGKGLGKEDGIE